IYFINGNRLHSQKRSFMVAWFSKSALGSGMDGARGQSPNKALQVPQLHTAENLVLVCFRLWAHSHCRQTMQPVPDWRLGFRAARLPPCTEGLFDQLLH